MPGSAGQPSLGWKALGSKSKHFCNHHGCTRLVTTTYCEEHAPLHKPQDNRASASERGYDWAWHKFSVWYLAKPEHQFCALHISRHCKEIADCVDHIYGLQGPNDPRKYDLTAVQPACRECNLLKEKQVMRGTWEYGEGKNENK